MDITEVNEGEQSLLLDDIGTQMKEDVPYYRGSTIYIPVVLIMKFQSLIPPLLPPSSCPR